MNRVNQIVVHQSPHIDELVAVWLLRNFGGEKFPEISKAKLITWGKKDLAQTSPEVAAMSGIILVGLGGGMFDDHVSSRRQECATTLVAKYLGIDDDPLLKRILKQVFEADSEASGELQWLAEDIKNLNRYWVGSIDPEELYRLVEPFIVVRIERQKEYLAAQERFDSCYRRRVKGFAIVAADGLSNKQFQSVARGKGADIIVQRNDDGLTQIFGSKGVDMAGLAVRVRKAEMAKSNLRQNRFLSDEELASTGTLPGIPHWYYEGEFLLNGSESFTDVTPSGISFRDLVYFIEKHLGQLDELAKEKEGSAVA